MTTAARLRLLALAATIAVGAVACGSSDSDGADKGATTTTAASSSGEKVVTGTADSIPATPANAKGCRTPEKAAALTKAPTVTIPDPIADAPFVTDDIPGCGDPIKAGNTISVQYILKSSTTGKVVDASWNRGAQPFQFTIGQGSVIRGWDEGLIGMRAGGRRTLVLPPDYAYGAQGSPPDIPANDTLVFVIDAVDAG